MINRRSFLKSTAALSSLASVSAARLPAVPTGPTLKSIAQGKIMGMYVVAHDIGFDPTAASIIAREFGMIADGNDLKFSDRLRPTPDTYNFIPGEWVMDWAHNNGLLFRGHTFVWHNALPKWFQSYVTKDNAQRVMTDHITNVARHYAGKVYSWDVVNEPIYHMDRPDSLRVKPWLDLIGPEYIDIAFHTAAAADPKAKLVLNECVFEHDVPAENQRRDALLQLLTRLKKRNVPVHAVGIQGHVRARLPLATEGMKNFMKAAQDLGLEIMITEFDVDDTNIPDDQIDQAVASKYAEFIELVYPYAKVITFEQLYDIPNIPKRPDGIVSRPNLFDSKYQPKPAYQAAFDAIRKAQASAHGTA